MTDAKEKTPGATAPSNAEDFAAQAARDEEKHRHLLADAAESFTPDEFQIALKVLATIANDRGTLSTVDKVGHQQLQFLTGKVARPDAAARKKLQRARRRAEKAAKREEDDRKRQDAEIRRKRLDPVFVTPPGTSALAFESAPAQLTDGQTPPTDGAAEGEDATLHQARRCYVCKSEYKTLHAFYDQLCPTCGDLNFKKRAPSHDLTGRTALITGARVKIGYHAAILMLRNGCHVVVSTRFPNDAAARYAKEPDYDEWKDRLDIYGLDLRHTPSVEQFCDFLYRDLSSLDFIIHNACQTVRRPPDFYAHMLEGEQRPLSQLPAPERPLVEKYAALREVVQQSGLSRPAELSQAATNADTVGMGSLKALEESVPEGLKAVVSLFPQGRLDADLQQVDLRTHNSWRLTLDEVPTIELLEVLLVNAVAPFVLSGRLRALMNKERTDDKHIVNVSAMEGQFHRNKTDKHPHTNMAKAALNMLTRTSAQDYVRDGIHMNAVDTGWITDEDPAHIAQRKIDMHQFSPPLDVVDGAARIVDPIFDGLQTGNHVWGQFLKDYAPTYW